MVVVEARPYLVQEVVEAQGMVLLVLERQAARVDNGVLILFLPSLSLAMVTMVHPERMDVVMAARAAKEAPAGEQAAMEGMEAHQAGVVAQVVVAVVQLQARAEQELEVKSEYGHGDLNEWNCKKL